jgi:hypothetical protein
MIRERKITYEVFTRDKADRESDDHEENGPPVCKIRLSELRSHLNELVTFINLSPDPEVQPYYFHCGAFRQIIVQKRVT